jgi:hypothetical protein
MADIVNLRLARKRADRDKAASRAADNRLAHSISKKHRNDAATERERLRQTLDGHRIEPGDRR